MLLDALVISLSLFEIFITILLYVSFLSYQTTGPPVQMSIRHLFHAKKCLSKHVQNHLAQSKCVHGCFGQYQISRTFNTDQISYEPNDSARFFLTYQSWQYMIIFISIFLQRLLVLQVQ